MDAHRAEYIEGLRQFADFLAAHPDYPPTREHYILADSDEQGVAELYRLAAILGAGVQEPGERGNWYASRKFAGLWVQIAYCTRRNMAAHYALTSYADNVRAAVTA